VFSAALAEEGAKTCHTGDEPGRRARLS